jgi:hypothetical protein
MLRIATHKGLDDPKLGSPTLKHRPWPAARFCAYTKCIYASSSGKTAGVPFKYKKNRTAVTINRLTRIILRVNKSKIL